MILKSIKLKNIRSYTEQKVEFPEGSILLAGDIGSGKSSILHSVEFALFGARRDSISGEALLRKGEKEGEVELSFELESRPITIKRKLKRQRDSVSQDTGFIIIDGRKIEGTATELKARVLDLLGYPKELLTKSKSLVYRYTVYTPQEEMKQILTEHDELRIDTLRKVFGIDRYKRMAENTSIFVKSIKEKKKELLGMMHGLDEKKAELKRRKESLATKEMSMKQLLPMVEQVKRKKEDIKGHLAMLEQEIAKLNDLKKRIEVCDARLMEIVRSRTKNRSELEAIDAGVAQVKKKLEDTFLEEKVYPPIEEVEADIEKREKDITQIASRKTELDERKKNILERIELLRKDHDMKSEKVSLSAEKEGLYKELLEELKDKEVINRSVEEVNRKLRELETIISELTVNQKNSEILKEEISSLEKCPTCRQDVNQVYKQSIIDEEDRKLKKIKAELEGLLAQKGKIAGQLEQHSQRLDALAEKERDLAAVNVELSNLKSLRSEIEQVKQSHVKLDQEKMKIISALEELDEDIIEKTKKGLDERKLLLKEINRYSLLLKEKKHNLVLLADKEKRKEELMKFQEQLKEEVKGINNEKIRINEDISKKAGVEEGFNAKKEEFERISEDEKRLAVRLGEVKKEMEGVASLISALDKDIAGKEGAGRKIDYHNSVQEWLEKMFINLMSTMERHIMARVHTQFCELFSTWFSLLIEDENISVRIDDTFSPIITQNGYDTDLNHLSGGEKTSIALAYRLALNRVINDIISSIKTGDLIILDEPTDGFSSEQLDRVRNVLDELSAKQTIIVSHEPKIESFVDHVIRIHKTDHVSRVVS